MCSKCLAQCVETYFYLIYHQEVHASSVVVKYTACYAWGPWFEPERHAVLSFCSFCIQKGMYQYEPGLSLYIQDCTRFVSVHTGQGLYCIHFSWFNNMPGLSSYIPSLSWNILLMSRHERVCTELIQFHILTYYAMLWYYYKQSISCLSQYVPPCTTGRDTSVFGFSEECLGYTWYRHLHTTDCIVYPEHSYEKPNSLGSRPVVQSGSYWDKQEIDGL